MTGKTTATVTRLAARQFQTSIPRPGCMVVVGTRHSPLYAAMEMSEANTAATSTMGNGRARARNILRHVQEFPGQGNRLG